MLDTANPVRTDTHAQRKATVDRLTALSIRNKTNPVPGHRLARVAARGCHVDAPQTDDGAWHPGGRNADARAAAQAQQVESIWFYSFNVHGERHLLRDVLNCMHSPGYEDVSDYMHHFSVRGKQP